MYTESLHGMSNRAQLVQEAGVHSLFCHINSPWGWFVGPHQLMIWALPDEVLNFEECPSVQVHFWQSHFLFPIFNIQYFTSFESPIRFTIRALHSKTYIFVLFRGRGDAFCLNYVPILSRDKKGIVIWGHFISHTPFCTKNLKEPLEEEGRKGCILKCTFA